MTHAVATGGCASWFASLGQPLRPEPLQHARLYFSSLGYPREAPIHQVADWAAAERIIRDPDWDSAWWQREQQERERLLDLARARIGEGALLERLTAATEPAGDAIHAAAIAAADRFDGVDEALVRAASGAGAMALNEATLARLAGCGSDHLFMRKYVVFQSGRWPLGVVGGALQIF